MYLTRNRTVPMPIKLVPFNTFTLLPRIATSAFYKHLSEKGFNFRIY